MKLFLSALACFLFLTAFNSYSQSNFYKEYWAANPAKPTDTFPINEKIAIHQAYLKKAIEANNVQQQFYGHLYLSNDYKSKSDFMGATHRLFIADSIAQHSGNLNWMGIVSTRQGYMKLDMNDMEAGLQDFRFALECCTKTKDSIAIAINLEAMALAFRPLQKYDSAKYYFELARPLLKKHTDSYQMANYYSNYSELTKDLGDTAATRRYLDSSWAIVGNENDLGRKSGNQNNLAAFYLKTGEYDKAIKILKEYIPINKAHGWAESLSDNYKYMSIALKKKGDYRTADEYLQMHYSIADSLNGTEVRVKIAYLNASYKAQKKETDLKQSQLELLTARRSFERKTWMFIAGFLLLSFVSAFWIMQAKKAKKEQLENQQSLSDLTNILLEKNIALAEMDEQLSKWQRTTPEAEPPLTVGGTDSFKEEETASLTEKEKPQSENQADDFEKTIYNQRILTSADWSAFKMHFEKAYPGYLLRLRNAFTTITEAEERMFLFIKLKLTNKEAAAILGISADSVKKTRTRLRKRLELEEGVDLDVFVQKF